MKRVFRRLSGIAGHADRCLERRRWLFYVLAALITVAAAFCRWWAAPLSAGPDIGQFWAFAKVFELQGFDFYSYASGTGAIFPEQGWGFVYPPVWLFILRLALLASPDSMATATMVDVSWRLAMKTPIIAADLAIGGLLLWAIPGSRVRRLLLAGIWLFHPTAWYNSAVFGQFDAVGAVFLTAAVIMFARGKDVAGFVLAGLAVLTKQHTAFAVVLMLAVVSRHLPMRRLLADSGLVLGLAALLSAPFLLRGDFFSYARAVVLPAQQPAYQLPLVYAFSGSGSLLTYLHNTLGWNTEHILSWNVPLLAVSTLVSFALCYVKRIPVVKAGLIGILLFVALFYRVNYQYLIIYLPLALLALPEARNWIERGLLIALIGLPAAWIWLFDVSFWFRYAAPRHDWVHDRLAQVGLTNYPPDAVYVGLAVALMLLSLSYVVVVLARHSRPPALSQSAPHPGYTNSHE